MALHMGKKIAGFLNDAEAEKLTKEMQKKGNITTDTNLQLIRQKKPNPESLGLILNDTLERSIVSPKKSSKSLFLRFAEAI
jgi:hypothetical protein